MINIKTLIELFDECQIENVIAGLKLNPDKIIFVGFKNIMTKSKTNAIEHFFSMKDIHIECEYEIVGRYNYQDIVDKLNNILDRNEDCCFDLTGGKELVLTAMGEVSSKRNIPMVQFNIKSGELIPVKNCDKIEVDPTPAISVGESIALNGGSIVHDGTDYNWQLTEDFKADIQRIWDICRKDCRLWNKQSNIFSILDKVGRLDYDLSTYVDLERYSNLKNDLYIDEGIIKQLLECKLLLKFEQTENIIRFQFKNNQVRECITKAGNILELYLYYLIKEYVEPSFYDDVDVGVIIDWDGIVHKSEDDVKDTKNEIDLLVTKNLIPIFISCKNGEVHKEALYELSAVAEKFGGKYSKKFVFSTYFGIDLNSKKHILQRARDMHIDIVEGIEKLSADEIVNIIKSKLG